MKILTPFDFSEKSYKALHYAAKIVRLSGGGIYLLYILNPEDIPEAKETQKIPQPYLQNVKNNFAGLVNNENYKNLIKGYRIKLNETYKEINQATRKFGAELIIAGVDPSDSYSGILQNDDISKVIRHAVCPVITVNHLSDFGHGIKNIVFASEFDQEMPEIARQIKAFAGEFEATLHLLRVNTVSHYLNEDESIARIKNFAERNQFKNCTVNVYDHRSVDLGIIEFSKKSGADLIVMVTHGRKGLRRILNSSITERMAHNINHPVPVMSFNFKIEETSNVVSLTDAQ